MTLKERREIGSLSALIFNGQYDAEVYDEYKRWNYWIVDIFLPLVDTENGNYLHYPFDGGLLDQPYVTMSVLNQIQIYFREHISKINEDKIKER